MALLKKRCWTSVYVLLGLLACIIFTRYTSFEPLTTWTTWRQIPAPGSAVHLSSTPVKLSAPSLMPGSSPIGDSYSDYLQIEGEDSLDEDLVAESPEDSQSLQNSQNSQYSSVMTGAAVSQSTIPQSTSTPSFSSESTADPQKKIFILTHSFGGQLTRAVRNMMMQQCWARDLSPAVRILEPFSQESQLLHTPQIWEAVKRGKTQNVARFSDYFDLELYNNISLQDGGAPLIKWEELLLHAPRQAIAVLTPQASCSLIVNHRLKTTVDRFFKDFLKTLQQMNFKILNIVAVNCYDRNRSKKLKQLLLTHMHNSTIVFSSWRNYNVAKTWLTVNPRCDISDKYPADRLRPSSKMRRHTHNYHSQVLRADKTIAIMLRVERFLTLKKSSQTVEETVDSCLEKTLEVYSDLKRDSRWAGSQPFLTLDIGRYGSGLMQRNETVQRMNESLEAVTSSVRHLLVEIYEGRWRSLEEWEESFLEATEGIGERGYVAMLQREIAVGSDCLILMGGGSFQEVAANHYLRTHPDSAQQCLHVVCAATALTTTLENSERWRNKKPGMGRRHHKL